MAGWWWVDGEELVRAGAAVLHTVLHTQSLWWALCVDEPVWGRGGGCRTILAPCQMSAVRACTAVFHLQCSLACKLLSMLGQIHASEMDGY
jgi:hypothetical protein